VRTTIKCLVGATRAVIEMLEHPHVGENAMTLLMRSRVLLIAVVIGCLPRPAHAEGYINAGLGISFGSPSAEGRANFAADLGWLPREPIGVEVDVTYAPSFFKNPGSFTENRLTTVMGNVIVAGWDRRGRYGRSRRGAALRPYVSGGFGLMSERVSTAAAPGAISNSHLGVNAGLGVMALPRGSFGVRAELRYFQDLVGTNNGNTTGINFGSFHFWRASIGAVMTF
jgi:hypothetical protein